MTLTIHIYYTGPKGATKQFADEMISSGLVDKIRATKGNLQYDYFIPYADNDSLLLIDQWENQDALDAHHDSDTMQQILQLRQKYHLTMKVERFKDDKDSMTDKDRAFIAN